jgi:hypothetical protein
VGNAHDYERYSDLEIVTSQNPGIGGKKDTHLTIDSLRAVHEDKAESHAYEGSKAGNRVNL